MFYSRCFIFSTTPPNTEIWSTSGANCKIIVNRLEDAGKRKNSFAGSENLQPRK